MKETRRVDMLDAYGFGYVARLTFEPKPDADLGPRVYWIDWALYEVIETNANGTVPGFATAAHRADSSEPGTKDLDQAEPEATGFCKWDGCAEFGLTDNRHHVCDAGGLRDLLDAVKRVYVECATITASGAKSYCEQAGWTAGG